MMLSAVRDLINGVGLAASAVGGHKDFLALGGDFQFHGKIQRLPRDYVDFLVVGLKTDVGSRQRILSGHDVAQYKIALTVGAGGDAKGQQLDSSPLEDRA